MMEVQRRTDREWEKERETRQRSAMSLEAGDKAAEDRKVRLLEEMQAQGKRERAKGEKGMQLKQMQKVSNDSRETNESGRGGN